MANDIEFRLKTSADLQGIRQLKKELEEVRRVAQQGAAGEGILGGDSPQKLASITKAANTLEYAMQAAFDPKINTVNIEKFNRILATSGTNAKKLSQELLSAGPAGQKAFLSMTTNLTHMGTAVKQTSKLVEQMSTTLKNTVKWGVTSSLWNTMLSTTQQAYGYVKNLDKSLNDIRIVTGLSADEMERFGKAANTTAKELAVSTKEFTEGALIYFQQGLDEETSTRLAEITAKAANVTGQSMKAVSEELTAVWNGYAVSAQEAELYVDRLAAIAANSASDLEELSVGMSKVASAANAMGVSEEQLASQISTIISITRQAPESVGTALKTIYARMSSIKAGAEEEGVDLMKYTKSMAEMGINVLDAKNQLRDMGDVIEEIGAKWQTMSKEQQIALAQTMAGTRQYNNLIALFDNFDQYSKMMNIAENSAGTLQKQQETYLESISAKTEQMRASFEDLYDSLFDESNIKGVIEAITGLANVLTTITNSIGGLSTILPTVGLIGARVFRDQIGIGISNAVSNTKALNAELQVQKANQEFLQKLNLNVSDSSASTGAIKAYERQKELNDLIYDKQIELNQVQKESYNVIQENNEAVGKMAIEYEEANIELSKIEEKYNFINSNAATYVDEELEANRVLNEREKELEKISKILQQSAAVSNKIFKSEQNTSGDIKNMNLNSFSRSANLDEIFADYSGKGKSKTAKEFKALEEELLNVGKAGQDTADVIDKINIKIKGMQKGDTGLLEEHFKEINEVITQVNENTDIFKSELRDAGVSSSGIETLSERFREMSFEGKNTDKIFKLIIQELEGMVDKIPQLNGLLNEYRGKLNQVEEAQKRFEESLKLETAISNIVNLAGAMGQLAMAWNTMSNLGSIITNDDLSIFQKASQIAINLSMVLPMLTSAYKVLTSEKVKDTIASIAQLATTNGLIKAKTAEAGATVGQTAATEGLTVAQWALNAAMDANPIGVIIVAITALIGIISIATAKYKKAQEQIIETSKTSIKEHEKNKEVINQENEALISLSSTLDDLNQKYKDGKISLSEYRKEMAKAYEEIGDYDSATSALTSTPEEEEKRIKKLLQKKRKEELKENEEILKSQEEATIAKIRENIGHDNITIYGEQNSSILENAGVETEHKINNEYIIDLQSLVENYAKHPEEIKKAISQLTAIDKASIEDALEGVEENFEEILETITDNLEIKKEILANDIYNTGKVEKIDLEDVDTIQEYNKAVDTLAQKAIDEGLFTDLAEATEWAESTLSKYNDELDKLKTKEAIIDNYVNNSRIGKGDNIPSDVREKNLKNLKEELIDKFKDWTAEEMAYIPVGLDVTHLSEEEIEKAREEAQRQVNADNARVAIGITLGAIDTLESGKELDEETTKQLDEQLSKVKGLETEYQELQMIRDKSSQDYLYKLMEINEKLEDIAINDAVEDFNTALEVQADTTEFDNAMEQIMDADYSVSVAVNADIQSDFDEITNQLDDIEKYASMIGEDFIVAGKDIEELNDAFPGILQGAQDMGDGTIKIEKDIAAAAVESSREAAQASVEEAAARMDAEAALLAQKAEVYGQMAEIAFAAAQAEGDSSNYVKQIEAKNDELAVINNKEKTQIEQDNALNVAENAMQNASATANNWVSAYQAAANAAYQFGVTAASAHQAATTGQPPAAPNISNSFSSTSGAGANVSSATITQPTEDTTSEEWTNLGKQYQELQKRYQEMANNAIGKATELRIRGKETQFDLDNLGKGKSSKGGGGSKQNKEKQKYELDAYKQLERAIDSLNKKLDGLKERQEHLSGKKLVKNIEAQTKAYVKQAAAIQQLNQAAQVEVATQKKNIADQGYNLKYDKSGNITQKSYNKAYDDEWKRYNAAIDTYNKSAKDEAAEDALKAAKDRYDQFKEYTDKYNTAKAKAEDTLNQLMEAIQQVADSNLAKFNVEFDAKLNTQEAERSWLKFQQKYKKDFKKVAKHTAQDIKDIYDEASSYNKSFGTEEERFKGIENQYNKMLDVYKDFTDKNGAVSSDNVEALTKKMQKAGVTFTTVADMQKALQESFDNLQEYAEQVYDALTEGWQNYIESIDEVIDHMDELMETYDKLTDKNEYYLKVAELTAGVYNKEKSAADQLKEAQLQYYDTTIKNSESKLRAINNEEAAYKKMLKTIVDKHTAEGKTIEEIKLMEDYTKVANKLNTLEKEKQETVKNTLQAGIDKRNMEREEAYEALESSLAGSKYKNFKEMNEEWDKTMKNQERYYDSTEKLYQLESLANKYQTAIDKGTLSIANQEKLNNLKEKELKYLKEKEKLTKDDIALAEQRYNVAMAEMALEEAQNSKNEMKVVRNAEGNWSYQYVADEEDVADKKQDLLDQYNELYEMSKKAYQDSLELAMQAKEEFLEKYKEIVEDATLTDKDRQTKLNDLAKDYKDLINQYYEEADAFQIDLYASSAVIIKDYYDGNIEELKTATEQEQEIYKAATENNISNYDAYRDEVLDGTSIITQAEEKFTENSIHLTQDIENEKRQLEKTMTVDIINAYNEITSAEEEYGRTCDTVSGLVNEHWDKITEAIKKTEEEGIQAENSIKEYGEEANNQIEEELESLRELEDLWNSVQKAIESCKNAMDDLMQAAEDGITAVKQAAETARNVGNQATNTAASSAGAGGGSSTTSGPKATQSATHNGQWQVTYDYGNRKETKTYTNYEDQKKDMQAKNAHFLSGGYTGAWTNGSSEDNGRLAMLHQKELVLNKDDTSNFLEAINTVRDIASLSTSVGNVIVDKIAEMIGRMVGTNINKINNVSNNDNSSNVVYNINAEFPNATDKNSIIAAFESLPNITSQKVNAKFR